MATDQKRGWSAACQEEYAGTFFRLSEVFLAFASGVTMLVTFGTPYWVEQSIPMAGGGGGVADPVVLYHSGLWQNCTVTSGCWSIGLNPPSFLIASRLFMCLALTAGLLAWSITIISLVQHKTRWLLGSAICYGIQAFLMLIGLGSYGRIYQLGDSSGGSPGWSYSAGWIAFVLAIISSIAFILVALYTNKQTWRYAVSLDQAYAPLAQFEASTASEDDEDL